MTDPCLFHLEPSPYAEGEETDLSWYELLHATYFNDMTTEFEGLVTNGNLLGVKSKHSDLHKMQEDIQQFNYL